MPYRRPISHVVDPRYNFLAGAGFPSVVAETARALRGCSIGGEPISHIINILEAEDMAAAEPHTPSGLQLCPWARCRAHVHRVHLK